MNPLLLAMLVGGGSMIGGNIINQLFGMRSEGLQVGLGREQIKSNEKITRAKQEGEQRALREAQTSKEQYLQMLMEMNKTNRGDAREERIEGRRMGNEQQRTALLLAAIQSLGGRQMGRGESTGMLSAMRGM